MRSLHMSPGISNHMTSSGRQDSAFDAPDRRRALKTLAAAGIGTVVFQRALAAQAAEVGDVTAEMIRQAEWIAGLELSEEQRQDVAKKMRSLRADCEELRKVPLVNSVSPAVMFQPAPWDHGKSSTERGRVELTEHAAPQRPDQDDDLAFLPVTELSVLLRTRKVSSVELTKLYLGRLEKFDPLLKCVVTLTEELALKQAKRADNEIAAGRYRGPLHGVPWGAKDLISVPGYPTTWGAPQYREQQLEDTATVARRLEQAGAVLVAKLSLGALAMGDRWFGGITRNPWYPKMGSSGSSAGSAAATAAGLVGFSLGSETLGSIVSPSKRCGTSGLRPTYGRVSRAGCMALSWSMDKIGPICRSLEDTALVLDAIHGADGLDAAAVTRPFHWPFRRPLSSLTVGYVETNRPAKEREELRVLKDLGVKLKPIKLPTGNWPLRAITMVLDIEAATVFDDLTRTGNTEGLNSWPSTFRRHEFVPAVEYLRANRIRSLVMQDMRKVMKSVDLYVGGGDLVLTNLTGHPSAVLPNGFRKVGDVETPHAITFTGQLYGETELLAVAHAYLQATEQHLPRPPIDKWLRELNEGEKKEQ